MLIDELTEKDVTGLPITDEMVGKVKEQFTKYLIYKNRKDGAFFQCTGCFGKGLLADRKLNHKEHCFCPFCGEDVIAYSAGYGRKQLSEKMAVGLYYSIDNILVIRICTIYMDIPDSGLVPIGTIKPKFDFRDEYVYCFTSKRAVRFINRGAYDCKEGEYRYRFEKMKSVKPLPMWWNGYAPTVFRKVFPVNPEEICNTELKYSFAEKYSHEVQDQIDYLIFYKKHNTVEYLLKTGFRVIVDDLVTNSNSAKVINWKSNNMLRMLGIRKSDIDFCKQLDINELVLYRDILNSDSGKDTEFLFEYFRRIRGHAIDLHKLTGLTYSRMQKYIEKQRLYAPCQRPFSTKEIIVTWKDYIELSIRYFGSIEEILPKNLFSAHDRIVNEIDFMKNQEKDKLFQKRNKILKKLIYENDTFVMKIPQSGEDIIAEGNALKHCVGSYVDRHADGRTNILFIRRKEKPDTPYFTIEISNDRRIIQCHGYRNEHFNPKPEEIIQFEEEYKSFLSKVK